MGRLDMYIPYHQLTDRLDMYVPYNIMDRLDMYKILIKHLAIYWILYNENDNNLLLFIIFMII